MPTFRQRPLTWLFFVALACVNAAALATDPRLDWYSEVLAAQVMISAGWLALGRAHRLARAAAFVVYPLVAAAPDYFAGDSRSFPPILMWEAVLGLVVILSVSTALASAFWLIVISRVAGQKMGSKASLQFSVAEIFGWMIIVAIASVILRNVTFFFWPHWGFLLIVAPAALQMALILRGDGISVTIRSMVALAVILSALAMAGADSGVDLREAAVVFAITGVWALVQRLDESGVIQSRVSGDATPHRTSAPPDAAP